MSEVGWGRSPRQSRGLDGYECRRVVLTVVGRIGGVIPSLLVYVHAQSLT